MKKKKKNVACCIILHHISKANNKVKYGIASLFSVVSLLYFITFLFIYFLK